MPRDGYYDAAVALLDPESLRRFIGNALKLTVPPHLRDEKIAPSEGAPHLGKEGVIPFVLGFNEIGACDATGNAEIHRILKRWVRFHRGLKRYKLRVARRRINQIRGRARALLRKKDIPQPLKGLRFFTVGVRADYLGKRMGDTPRRDPFELRTD